MRSILALAFVFLAALSIPSVASAQNQNQKNVAVASEAFSAKLDQLLAVAGNVSQMGVNVPDREYLAVRGVTTALSTVNSFMLLVQTEASIYTVMVDPRDAAVVLSALSRGCYSLRRMVESAVESANSSLPRITSTAVVQEITKARDLVGEIGDSRLCKLVPAYKP